MPGPQLPPHLTGFEEALKVQCKELAKDKRNIIPVLQALINAMGIVIGVISPKAARDTVIEALQRDLPTVTNKYLDATNTTGRGVIIPGAEDKFQFGV